jgi:hypothetical protein
MRTHLFTLIAASAILCFAGVGIASAGELTALQPVSQANSPGDPTIDVAFPAAGNAYCSAFNGCGTIPSGGQTAYMWTTGDYVMSPSFLLPTTTVSDLSADWEFQDYLNSGNTETWFVYVNGVAVAQAFLPDDSGNGDDLFVTGTVNFAPIFSATSTFQVELILQNTIPGGGGSVAWLDGGITGLSYNSTVPEPGSLLLLGSALALGGLLLRRKRRA